MQVIFKTILLCLLCTINLPANAFDGITFYGTTISNRDRVNSFGERLTSVRDILRQDRANMHKYHSHDNADQYESFFSKPKNRNMFNTAKLKVNAKLAQQIKHGRPVNITVFVYPGEIEVIKGLPTPGIP